MMLRSILVSACVLGSSAFAQDNTGKVSLQDLKARCADILANPQMVKPAVKVTCNERSYRWNQSQPLAGKLSNTRNIGAQVQMKGFQVDQQDFALTVADTAIECQQFTKVEHIVRNIETEITCEQLASTEDLGAYCAPIIDSHAAQDPGLVEEKPTSEVLTLCPNQ